MVAKIVKILSFCSLPALLLGFFLSLSEFEKKEGLYLWNARYLKSHDKVFLQKIEKHYASAGAHRGEIPKKVHWIWLGEKPFPHASIPTMRAWIDLHPDWEFYFWTDDPEKKAPIEGVVVRSIAEHPLCFFEKQFKESSNFGEKSDLWRYEILFFEGGIYVDHDSYPLKSFTDLVEGYDFFAALEAPHFPNENRAITVGIGILGAKPFHFLMKETIDSALERWDPITKMYRDKGFLRGDSIVIQRSYLALTVALEKKIGSLSSGEIILPASYFYPKSFLKGIYSVHLYGDSWVEKGNFLLREVKKGLESSVIELKLVFIVFVALILAFLFRARSLITILLLSYVMPFSLEAEIPEHLHFLWLGGEPQEGKERIVEWEKLYPECKITLWSDRYFPPLGKKIIRKKIQDEGFSDLLLSYPSLYEGSIALRLAIVHKFGGFSIANDLKPSGFLKGLFMDYCFAIGKEAYLERVGRVEGLGAYCLGSSKGSSLLEGLFLHKAEYLYKGNDKDSILTRVYYEFLEPLEKRVNESGEGICLFNPPESYQGHFPEEKPDKIVVDLLRKVEKLHKEIKMLCALFLFFAMVLLGVLWKMKHVLPESRGQGFLQEKASLWKVLKNVYKLGKRRKADLSLR